MNDKALRLRITFARDDAQKYITHLDLMHAWERALRRANVPLTLSQGFNPRPRIALAAPLAVGVTSVCELLEIFCTKRISSEDLFDGLVTQLPAGIRVLSVEEVPVGLPSVQSLVRAAQYRVDVPDDRSEQEWRHAIDTLLALDELPWEHQRGDETRHYDLRRLIFAIELVGFSDGPADAAADGATGAAAGTADDTAADDTADDTADEEVDGVGRRAQLHLRLRNDESGSGRPEQVTRALGAQQEPWRIHRVALDIEQPSIARAAYSAAGRAED